MQARTAESQDPQEEGNQAQRMGAPLKWPPPKSSISKCQQEASPPEAAAATGCFRSWIPRPAHAAASAQMGAHRPEQQAPAWATSSRDDTQGLMGLFGLGFTICEAEGQTELL